MASSIMSCDGFKYTNYQGSSQQGKNCFLNQPVFYKPCEIPRWARRLIFGTYCRIYQVNLDEAIESDLTQYPTLNEFFRRKLKPECRPIDQNADLVVPCDGKVLHCGVITDENQVEQVKGMTYTLNEFLGGSYNNLQIKDEVNLFLNILLFRITG